MGTSSDLISETGCRHKSISFWGIWLALLVLAVLLFTATANRGIQWQDSGHQILRVITWELSHPLIPKASPEKYRDSLAKGGRIVLVPVNVNKLKTDPPFGKWNRWGDLYTLDVEVVAFRNE